MKPHVSEDTLAAIAALGAREMSDGARAHLATCPDCADRLESLTHLLSEVRTTALNEADEVFDDERLARQRDHILRRIEHAGRPARVIEFPHRAARIGRPVRPIAARWVAAAAAAGLVIGVYAGSHMNGNGQPAGSDAHLVRIAAPTAQSELPSARDIKLAADDEILSEVETALVTQGSPQLRALDALTPRFREVGLNIR